jgi:hypothetical protein
MGGTIAGKLMQKESDLIPGALVTDSSTTEKTQPFQ